MRTTFDRVAGAASSAAPRNASGVRLKKSAAPRNGSTSSSGGAVIAPGFPCGPAYGVQHGPSETGANRHGRTTAHRKPYVVSAALPVPRCSHHPWLVFAAALARAKASAPVALRCVAFPFAT